MLAPAATDPIHRACTSKNRYSDRFTAVAMGISQVERYGCRLYAYQCKHCNGWHLTKCGRGRDGNPVLPCHEKVFG